MKKNDGSEDVARKLVLSGYTIPVVFKPHSVHITSNEDLLQLLETKRQEGLDDLVTLLPQEFRATYGYDLDIEPASLAVEIWGHVYCERLADVLAEKVPLQLMEKIAGKVIAYCEVIDCGESGYDNNRLFWDLLAPFKKAITGWMPPQSQ